MARMSMARIVSPPPCVSREGRAAAHTDPVKTAGRSAGRRTVRGVIVDRAIYRDGVRAPAPEDLAALNARCREGDDIAWIGLYRPDAAEFADVARHFDLHELAVEDAV